MSNRKKHDKILDNDFNTGNIDFNVSQKSGVENDSNLTEYYQSTEYSERSLSVLKDIKELYDTDPFLEKFHDSKKLSKQYCGEVYDFFMQRLDDIRMVSRCELFIIISEFFNVQPKVMWTEIHSKYKEDILQELDEDMSIFKRKQIKRLF